LKSIKTYKSEQLQTTLPNIYEKHFNNSNKNNETKDIKVTLNLLKKLSKDDKDKIFKFIENWKDEVLMWMSYNQKLVEKYIDDFINLSKNLNMDINLENK